jgi:tetratricopeptide (TPR) repeat protein
MKQWIQLLLAAGVAGTVGFASALVASPGRAARGAAPDTAGLEHALSDLRAEQTRLAERLAGLASAPAAHSSSARAPSIDLDAAIAAYMAKQRGAPADDAPGEGNAGPAELESATVAERILSGAVTGEELERLWHTLRQEKKIDGVLAEIERQAALAPHNPDLQNELGKAYIQKLFDAGIGPMAATWGERADQAFDRALALDDTHWEARFQKAMALSNWPEFMGKRGEALHQFETLMAQQERATPERQHALTYFFLGNLYDQGGDREKALATWKRGAARFPDDRRLAGKLEGK